MILLDTHIVVWLALAPQRLSQAAVRAIQEVRSRNQGLAISTLTLFELAQVITRGRVQITEPLDLFIQEIETHFVVKPVTGRIAVASAQLSSSYPKDPLDRLIGATALTEGIPLVTADQRIRNAPDVQTIW